MVRQACCLFLSIQSAFVLLAGPVEDFVDGAQKAHGEAGERAARFLVQHMPDPIRMQVLRSAWLPQKHLQPR